jgi:hypothetical protein
MMTRQQQLQLVRAVAGGVDDVHAKRRGGDCTMEKKNMPH